MQEKSQRCLGRARFFLWAKEPSRSTRNPPVQNQGNAEVLFEAQCRKAANNHAYLARPDRLLWELKGLLHHLSLLATTTRQATQKFVS